MKTVAQKMGIKENASAYFVNAPDEALDTRLTRRNLP